MARSFDRLDTKTSRRSTDYARCDAESDPEYSPGSGEEVTSSRRSLASGCLLSLSLLAAFAAFVIVGSPHGVASVAEKLGVLPKTKDPCAPGAPELCMELPGADIWALLSTRGPSALRLRLVTRSPTGAVPPALDTPMVGPDEPDADWQTVVTRYGRGIESAVGTLVISKSGRLTLLNQAGLVVTRSSLLLRDDQIFLSGRGGMFYGRGCGASDASVLASYGNVTPRMNNEALLGSVSYAPHYYSTDGYAALGVATEGHMTLDGPVLAATYDAGPGGVLWRQTRREPFDLYLMPAATLELGTAAYYELIGRPRVPPRWSFGFVASRWGWTDAAYVEATLRSFRDGGYPADAFIMDFEWYSNESDYAFAPGGKPYCDDFGFSSKIFTDPQQQLAHYKKELHFRMGGIRKPRLCGSKSLRYARSQGWLLPGGEPGGDPTSPDFNGYYAIGRQLNFSKSSAREWYSGNHEHYVDDGVAFWWNDEGETDYFTFYWWNVAQAQALRSRDPERRFYSINRNFVPGMARLGVGLWTGDSGALWSELAAQPGFVLNWALAGAPYVGSDIGGFKPETTSDLIARWYQVGVFMPVMRVHSTKPATPHWPWLWGHEAGQAMKKALELRYRLIPYHYSLAHDMFLNRGLWMRPMAIAFPDEASLTNLTHQWMDGDVLVAPVLRQDSLQHVRLPPGTWYPFDGGDGEDAVAPQEGPAEIQSRVPLAALPAYVRAGSIVPLAPLVQHTDALPGGPLEVRVYAGADASFELFEDDGETTAYEREVKRSTRFAWDELQQRLRWNSDGPAAAGNFERFFLRVFGTRGGRNDSVEVDLSRSGEISLAA